MYKSAYPIRNLALLMLALLALMTYLSGVTGTVQAAPVVEKVRPVPQYAAGHADGLQQVRVGVYVLSVGNLEVATGTYSMDFYLQFKCDTPCEPRNFDIMNAESYSAEEQTSDNRGGTFYTFRVKANLTTNLNLVNYPFDQHQLAVVLEDKNLGNDKLVYQYDRDLSGVDVEARAAGWDISPAFDGEVTNHVYPMFADQYSRFRFYVTILHPWLPSFMKGLFAAIVIVGVGMLSFLMNADHGQDRIALTSGTLASAIFYHMTLTSSVPPIGYMTYADKFMILQYIYVTISLAVAVALFLLAGREKTALAEKVHIWTRFSVPIAWVASMLLMHQILIGFGNLP